MQVSVPFGEIIRGRMVSGGKGQGGDEHARHRSKIHEKIEVCTHP